MTRTDPPPASSTTDASPSTAGSSGSVAAAPSVPRALPGTCYAGPAAADLDRRTIFARGWQLVGHAAQVAGTGDHLVAEIAGVPLLVVRGDDGALRALHNVCRHRAGPLATCDGRGARHFACRYHGWTYALDGALKGAPGLNERPGFERAGLSLGQAPVREWLGLVFAALDDAAPRFEDWTRGIEARLARRVDAVPLDRYRFHERTVWPVACNWKVYVDNFLEGYHVPRVHPGLNAVLDAACYRTDLSRWQALQSSVLAPGATYDAGEALYWFLFPNTMLNVLPGRLQTNRVLPASEDRCTVVVESFYAPGTDPDLPARDAAFAAEVQEEDAAICAAVQRGLASGVYVPGPLHPDAESGVAHFHALLRAAWDAPAAERAAWSTDAPTA